MPLVDVARAIGVDVPPGSDRVIITGVSTDSREVKPSDLFVAIKGVQHDGHTYLDQAISNGAAACVVSRNFGDSECQAKVLIARASTSTGKPVHRQVCPCHPMLHVPDTVEALGKLAAYYRESIINSDTRVIAVTGSNGKTTTKQLIHHLLSSKLKGRASKKSFNNNIGVPLTLLSVERDDEYVVVEIGTNAPGEVATLGRMASPDMAVVTSIGEAHLEGLSTIDAIVAEKTSLLDCLRPGGLAIVNVDRPELRCALKQPAGDITLKTFGRDASAHFRVEVERADLTGTRFILDETHEIKLTMPGAHHAGNAAAAWLVGASFDLPLRYMIDRMGTFAPAAGRAKVIECGRITIVDDSYNANPASMLAVVETLGLQTGVGAALHDKTDRSRRLKPAGRGRRVLVMGDMLELGEQSRAFHERILRGAIAAGIDLVVAVGERYGAAARAMGNDFRRTEVLTCATAADVGRMLVPVLTDGDCIWIKGSRSVGLERAVEDMKTGLAAWTHSKCTSP